jgi:NitT/TauT family transport system substrate-binding protein
LKWFYILRLSCKYQFHGIKGEKFDGYGKIYLQLSIYFPFKRFIYLKNKILSTVLIATFLLGACGSTAPTVQSKDIITMAISHNMGYGPFFIAESQGFFSEFGIQMNYVTIDKSSEAIALLVSGDIDVYASSLNTGLINVLSQDPNIKVVADRGHTKSGDCSYLGLVVRKDLYESGELTTAADLKGRTVSATSSGSTGFFLSTYLAQDGLTLDDVELTSLPNTAFLDALNNKSIDAVVGVEPSVTSMLKNSDSVLLVGAQDVFDVFQTSVVVFGKKLYKDNPDLGARFLAAYLKGVAQYNEGKTDQNIQILAENSGESEEVVRDSCWISIRQDGSIDFSGVEPLQNWSIENGFLEKGVTQEQFFDPSLLEAAGKLLDN